MHGGWSTAAVVSALAAREGSATRGSEEAMRVEKERSISDGASSSYGPGACNENRVLSQLRSLAFVLF
jgi:hypothetical protein